MAEGQEQLSTAVKNFHGKLRVEFKKGQKDAETLWKEHVKDKSALKQYSTAMHSLATGPWSKHHGGRIQWCVDTCQEYFISGGYMGKLLQKDLRRVKYNMPTALPRHLLPASPDDVDVLVKEYRSSQWRLLDVGSCYNPFSNYPQFDVTAIDIAPAVESVVECDFLHVDISQTADTLQAPTKAESSASNKCLKQLLADWYEVVVFSLLLSYLPSTRQRLECCINAHRVLRLHGLLLIITPDSSHQNRHADMMRSWKTCIEGVGFHRWRYIKDTHLHCMAFRKTMTVINYTELVGTHAMLYIPQDNHPEELPLLAGVPTEKLPSLPDVPTEYGSLEGQDSSVTFGELPFGDF